MNFSHQARFITKAVGLVGVTAFATLLSLPALAQSSRSSEGVTTPNIGPSESPTGSPSVPGVSGADDPGTVQDGSSVDRPSTMQNGMQNGMQNNRMQNGSTVERNALGSQDDSQETGPSTVPGDAFPGASESPSGSPSVPGNSGVDDPGNSRMSPLPERDALGNSSDSSDMQDDTMQNNMEGPSTVPGEAMPGASESPSGSPSVPGNSGVDDPGNSRMSPGGM